MRRQITHRAAQNTLSQRTGSDVAPTASPLHHRESIAHPAILRTLTPAHSAGLSAHGLASRALAPARTAASAGRTCVAPRNNDTSAGREDVKQDALREPAQFSSCIERNEHARYWAATGLILLGRRPACPVARPRAHTRCPGAVAQGALQRARARVAATVVVVLVQRLDAPLFSPGRVHRWQPGSAPDDVSAHKGSGCGTPRRSAGRMQKGNQPPAASARFGRRRPGRHAGPHLIASCPSPAVARSPPPPDRARPLPAVRARRQKHDVGALQRVSRAGAAAAAPPGACSRASLAHTTLRSSGQPAPQA